MSLELYLQYGIPTLFLALGLIVYAVVRFQSRRHDRRVARQRDQGRLRLRRTGDTACRRPHGCGTTLLDPPGRRS